MQNKENMPPQGTQENITTSRNVSLRVTLEGDPPGQGEYRLVVVYDDLSILNEKWSDAAVIETNKLPLDLQDPYCQQLVTQIPLTFLLRTTGRAKQQKDTDPLTHLDNLAGASVDLFPLFIGENEIFIRLPLVHIYTGSATQNSVVVRAITIKPSELTDIKTVTFMATLLSAHCLPSYREGTGYIGALSLDQVLTNAAIQFGMSLSSGTAKKIVWASASKCGQAANTGYNVPNEDIFIPEDLRLESNQDCYSIYWNAMMRFCVDPNLLRERLTSPLILEMVGLSKAGKLESRYMGFIDAGVLLQRGIYGVTVSTKLLLYDETYLPEGFGALIDVTASKPASSKNSARVRTIDECAIIDQYGHSPYVLVRFDLNQPLIPKKSMKAIFAKLYKLITPGERGPPLDVLGPAPVTHDYSIDVSKIKRDGGALAVHEELCVLISNGSETMNQTIARIAANNLIFRVRSMLRQFSPGNCSTIDLQVIIRAQAAAVRRAVSSSFAPKPPSATPPPLFASTRSAMAGNNHINDENLKVDLKIPNNPRAQLRAALRCLERGKNTNAKKYILAGLNIRTRSRYLLWLFGGQEFDKGESASKITEAAFRLAVKGDTSNGTSNAIGWAALHTFYHVNQNQYGAFAAAKKMRKCYELRREWKKFLQRWIDESGQEEIFWIPSNISTEDPILLAAAYFICLRCFDFSNRLLICVEAGCATKGSSLQSTYQIWLDIYYVRAASLLLQHHHLEALQVTTMAIKKFGPLAKLIQMKASCLSCLDGRDGECETALEVAEKNGSEVCPALLLKSAMRGIWLHTDPDASLQRAARAHKIAPCGHTALVIGRIYAQKNEMSLAKRWTAAAVKLEPLLADGWGVLAILAFYERSLDIAKSMIRTANEVGQLSPDVDEELKKLIVIFDLEPSPDSLVKNVCLCDYE